MRRSTHSLTLLAALAAVACGGGGGDVADGALDEMTVEAYPSDTRGALQVTSAIPDPADWFEVLLNGEQAYSAAPPLLGNTLELEPGIYDVDVNRTQRRVTIEVGRLTILRTGELLVEGQPDGAFWYPIQDGEQRLVSNPPILNSSVALFPGSYEVMVNEGVTVPVDSLGVARVLPGRVTTIAR